LSLDKGQAQGAAAAPLEARPAAEGASKSGGAAGEAREPQLDAAVAGAGGKQQAQNAPVMSGLAVSEEVLAVAAGKGNGHGKRLCQACGVVHHYRSRCASSHVEPPAQPKEQPGSTPEEESTPLDGAPAQHAPSQDGNPA